MYITILHYEIGKVIIDEVDDDIDCESYVSEKYGLDDTYFMSTYKLNLEINTI